MQFTIGEADEAGSPWWRYCTEKKNSSTLVKHICCYCCYFAIVVVGYHYIQFIGWLQHQPKHITIIYHDGLPANLVSGSSFTAAHTRIMVHVQAHQLFWIDADEDENLLIHMWLHAIIHLHIYLCLMFVYFALWFGSEYVYFFGDVCLFLLLFSH